MKSVMLCYMKQSMVSSMYDNCSQNIISLAMSSKTIIDFQGIFQCKIDKEPIVYIRHG